MPDGMVEVMGRRFPEGITACAVLAGATERIHMLTYVLVVPYRNPVLLAKQIATMEFIAGGRFTLGAAPGHLKREFEVLGIPFEERGWITDEYIRAMIECLSVGGSTGAIYAAINQFSATLDKDDVVVFFVCDGGIRYMTKVFSDEWMKQNNFEVNEEPSLNAILE